MFKRKYVGTEADRRKQAKEVFISKFESKEAYLNYCREANRRSEIRARAKRMLNKEDLTLDNHLKLLYDIDTFFS